MNSVEVTNLTKDETQVSNNITALDNVSLSIGEGIIFGLLGPNGAGKSIFNESYNWLNPDKGKILLKGDDIEELNLKYRLLLVMYRKKLLISRIISISEP
ncbi:MAG: ATP-binding cassette domain-containing protein [Ignavibacteriales bacterium]|nr:ATP-binding cassette domain-containing protein [Ignavibacteriales bacterium]